MPCLGIGDPCVNLGPEGVHMEWSLRDMTLDDARLNVTHSGNAALKRNTPSKIANLPVLTIENEGRLERRVR
jgi:hypothetical protein